MEFDQLVALTRIIGLAIFLSFFAGMLLWVYRPGSRRLYDEGALIPFADETRNGSKHHG